MTLMMSVSVAERLRLPGRGGAALLTERVTRLGFLLAVTAIAIADWVAATG